MKQFRRILYIPVIILLTASVLLIFQVFTVDTQFPLETIARITAVVTGILLFGLVSWDVRDTVDDWQMPEPEEPPRSDKVIYPQPLKDVEDAFESVKEAEDFAERVNGKVRIDIDIEDAREEDE